MLFVETEDIGAIGVGCVINSFKILLVVNKDEFVVEVVESPRPSKSSSLLDVSSDD